MGYLGLCEAILKFKINFKESGCEVEDWINLALNMAEQQTVVEMVMNF